MHLLGCLRRIGVLGIYACGSYMANAALTERRIKIRGTAGRLGKNGDEYKLPPLNSIK